MQRKASIPSGWKVPELFRKRLGDVAGHQRAMSADGHLLLILHEPPATDTAERQLRLFWRDAEGAWKSDCLGDGIASLQTHVSQYAKRVDELDKTEAQARGSDDFFGVRREVSPLRRAAHNMHEAMQAGHDAIPDDRELISCRNQAGTIERAAELIYEDAQHGLQYATAKQVEEQARAGQRLNLLAAVFFPIATLAAVFGMNMQHGLEHLAEPWLFWVILLVGIAMGLMVRSFVAPLQKRRRRPDHLRREPMHVDRRAAAH